MGVGPTTERTSGRSTPPAADPRAVVPILARVLVLVLVLVASACTGSSAAPGAERSSAATPVTRQLPTAADGAIRGVVDTLPDAGTAQGATGPLRVTTGEILVFGDSVARVVVDDVAARVLDRLVVDAIDCRRIDRGFLGPCGDVPAGVSVPSGLDDLEALVEDLRHEDALPAAAVVILANNSSLRSEDLSRAMDLLEGVPVVAWVSTRIDGFGRQDPNNQLLADLAERDSRAVVVDWFGASEGEDWLRDHVHPNETGQAALAALVADELVAACRQRACAPESVP